jgi:pimeloyl-ACP methyl ester carboxylesterase
MKRFFGAFTLSAFALAACDDSGDAAAESITAQQDKSITRNIPVERGYAPVNDLNMYYEIHGSGGTPLVLLRGVLMMIEISFGKVLPAFVITRQVIAVEQQGRGRPADSNRPLTYQQMADDTAVLLRQLKIKEADFFGYSMGGNTAYLAGTHGQSAILVRSA